VLAGMQKGELFMNEDQWSALAAAVVKVGDGRGFVVATEDNDRVIITAAHCLPHLPAVTPISFPEERTYKSLLGLLEATSCTVSAECLFVDPIADVAVLYNPDDQTLRMRSGRDSIRRHPGAGSLKKGLLS
jgi:hypothetical protein